MRTGMSLSRLPVLTWKILRTWLVPALGFSIPARALRRFWMMLAHYHGRTINYSELGRSHPGIHLHGPPASAVA